jgi:hypothetical protein
MSAMRTFRVVSAFLSGEGASRRQLLGRGIIIALAPVFIAMVQNGMLLPVSMRSPAPVPRGSEVVDDWMMVACSGLGMFCEYVALHLFSKLRKKLDVTTASAFLVGLFAVLIFSTLFVIGAVAAVDLVWPGARIGS